MVVTRLEPLTAEGKIALLSEYLDISLDDIQKISLDRKEAERLQKIAEQLQREQETAKRILANRKKEFTEAVGAGHIIVTIDGKVTSLKDICKQGTPDIDGLALFGMNARGKLLRHFRGESGMPNALKAICFERAIPCTCGKTHQVRVFISSFE